MRGIITMKWNNILLLKCGDIEANPGPARPDPKKVMEEKVELNEDKLKKLDKKIKKQQKMMKNMMEEQKSMEESIKAYRENIDDIILENMKKSELLYALKADKDEVKRKQVI